MLQLLRLTAPRRLALQPSSLRTLTTTTASPSTSTTSPSTPPTEPPTPSSRPPYHISRTPTNNLPVYHLSKRGGNYKITLIKKVDGNKLALKQELAEELQLDPESVRVKTVTGHLELRGYLAPQVMEFLQRRGF